MTGKCKEELLKDLQLLRDSTGITPGDFIKLVDIVSELLAKIWISSLTKALVNFNSDKPLKVREARVEKET